MDKKGGIMIKKCLAFFILGIFLALISGCETIIKGVKGAAAGVAEGAKDDWASLKKIDTWMRKNLW